MTTETTESRRAFERVCAEHDYSLATVPTEPPKYYEGDTQTAWLFWQASEQHILKMLESEKFSVATDSWKVGWNDAIKYIEQQLKEGV